MGKRVVASSIAPWSELYPFSDHWDGRAEFESVAKMAADIPNLPLAVAEIRRTFAVRYVAAKLKEGTRFPVLNVFREETGNFIGRDDNHFLIRETIRNLLRDQLHPPSQR